MLELLIASGLCITGAVLLLTSSPPAETSKGRLGRRTIGIVVSAAGLLCFIVLPFIEHKPALPVEPKDGLLEKTGQLSRQAKKDLIVVEEYKKHPETVPRGSSVLSVEIPEEFGPDVLRELLPLEFNDVAKTATKTGKRYAGLDKGYALNKKSALEKLGLKAVVESTE